VIKVLIPVLALFFAYSIVFVF